MAKLAFSKLKLKLNSSVTTINFQDEQVIEVKQYLPLEEKLALISDIINKSWDAEANFYNPCQYEVYTNFEVIKKYTNLVFTEKQEEDFYKTYDLLDSNEIIKQVWQAIPKDETDFIKNGVEKVIKAIYEYDHSVFGILEAIKTDYSNLDLNATEIQQKLADPENMDLLRTVLAKLG